MKDKRMKKICLLITTAILTLNITGSYDQSGTDNYRCLVAFQPNYEYKITGTKTDANYEEQWALHNDGTFAPKEQEDEFPVYLNPFEDPINDLWEELINYLNQMPDSYFGRKRYTNRAAASQLLSDTSKAEKGIDINIADAWKKYNGGTRETVVALIDTGIDYVHEDLASAIWKNEDEIAGDGIDNDGNGYVDDVYGWNFYDNTNQVYSGSEDSHGTHGAGTIAANRDNGTGIAGIAGNSKVKIMIVKALGGKEGSGSTESIIKAIQYAKDNGAAICNLSFGTRINDRELKEAIEDSGMLFIAAAGNGDNWTGRGVNDDKKPIYPASYDLDNIISVANLNYDGNLHYSSNYGKSTVDLAAPGSFILSTTPENTYSYMTGTSMAAPMVTGVAAMIYSMYPEVTIHQVKEMILQSVKPLESLKDKVATGGMLDASAAFQYDYTKIPAKANDPETSDASQKDSSSGNAPVISVEVGYSMLSIHKLMVLTVQDADQDLAGVYYKKGKLKVEDFSDLSTCEKVTLDASSKAVFKVLYGGVYTFYAYDTKGNSTVYTVAVQK